MFGATTANRKQPHTHTGGTEALRKAVSAVSVCTRKQRQPPQAPQCATVSETHGQWCTVQDLMHEVRAEPPDHRTGSVGLETGVACQKTAHSLQRPGWRRRGGGGGNCVAAGVRGWGGGLSIFICPWSGLVRVSEAWEGWVGGGMRTRWTTLAWGTA